MTAYQLKELREIKALLKRDWFAVDGQFLLLAAIVEDMLNVLTLTERTVCRTSSTKTRKGATSGTTKPAKKRAGLTRRS